MFICVYVYKHFSVFMPMQFKSDFYLFGVKCIHIELCTRCLNKVFEYQFKFGQASGGIWNSIGPLRTSIKNLNTHLTLRFARDRHC